VCYCASHCSDPESYVAAPGLLTVFPGTHTYTTSPEVVYRKAPGGATLDITVTRRAFSSYSNAKLWELKIVRDFHSCDVLADNTKFLCATPAPALDPMDTSNPEVVWSQSMPAPNVVICPQPWGAKWTKGGLEVQGAKLQQVPGGITDRELNFTRTPCEHISERLSTCNCFEFQSNLLYPHGARGNLDYLDYIRFTFKGDTGVDMKKSTQYAFGFYPDIKNIPQQWTYGQLGHVSEGDVKLEEVAHGKTEFTEGTAMARYSFRMTGEAANPDGQTVLVFGYDKYLAYIISSFGDKFSVFAIMTILITFCAAINNFGLFDIFFPEKVDEIEPAQLEPNMCCVAVFGSCCMFCKPKAEITKDATSRAASPSPTPGQSPARPAPSEEP